MKVSVVAVGRPRAPLARAIAEYEERAGRYWKLEVVEVRDAGGGGDPDAARTAEGEALLRRTPDDAEVVALTRAGKAWTSRYLARFLDERAVHGRPGVAFLIGGAHGLSGAVLDAADRRLSLGGMTFPHELARLVLAEQLYRAGTIVRGEPYHKG